MARILLLCLLLQCCLYANSQPIHLANSTVNPFRLLHIDTVMIENSMEGTMTTFGLVALLHGTDTLRSDTMVQRKDRLDFYNAQLTLPGGTLLQSKHLYIDNSAETKK